MGSERRSGESKESPEISSQDLINIFRGSGSRDKRPSASEVLSVFNISTDEVYEAWKLYRELREIGLTPKLAIRQLSKKHPNVFTIEVRDYLTALMLDTLTADMISEVKCG